MIDVEKWVKKHLGRTVLFKRGLMDTVCRVVGYNMLDDDVIVEIIGSARKYSGWKFIEPDDIIMFDCDERERESYFLVRQNRQSLYAAESF